MNPKKKPFLIGAHMPVNGNLYSAPQAAASIDCTALQLFTKNTRQWFADPLTEKECTDFKQAVTDANIYAVITHASYLINLASPRERVRTLSVNALKKELDRCHDLGINFLVLHPGAAVSETRATGLKLITEGLHAVFQKSSSKTMILLETMAGQGSTLGSTFEEIGQLLEKNTAKKRLGVCLDTCHIFAAGYDLRTKKAYENMWDKFDKKVGLKNLKAIHVNDSKRELGCCVDRHEEIGKGEIGEKFFALLFNDPRFFEVPKILETPKESLADDARNIALIKSLLTEKTKERFGL